MADPFVGEIRIFPLAFAPDGWAPCEGQLLPVAQNQGLFTLLSTAYGGDGVDTFALPDLRGRAPMHAGQGQGLSARALGEAGGSEQVTLVEAEVASHVHGFGAQSNRANTKMPDGSTVARPVGGLTFAAPSSSLVEMAEEAVSPAGGDQPHDNLMPYLTLGFCIALEGVFPTFS